jgi:hypothetical protein
VALSRASFRAQPRKKPLDVDADRAGARDGAQGRAAGRAVAEVQARVGADDRLAPGLSREEGRGGRGLARDVTTEDRVQRRVPREVAGAILVEVEARGPREFLGIQRDAGRGGRVEVDAPDVDVAGAEGDVIGGRGEGGGGVLVVGWGVSAVAGRGGEHGGRWVCESVARGPRGRV